MKLLDELRRQIDAVGPLRKAWFTTFNINFDLLETWILPLLAGCDTPKSAAGYGEIQSRLFGDAGDTQTLDVRVFCDERTLRSSMRKRTSVPVHGIDFRRAVLTDDETKFKPGLFHPKVIYLEGTKGAVIGAGSANLSIDAWSRNRECFHFEALRDESNLAEVMKFFQRIHAWAGVQGDVVLDVPVRSDAKVDWAFVSSLSRRPFLERLLESGSGRQDLTVWSPYFSEDLARLLAGIAEVAPGPGKISLVPDIKDWVRETAGRMRISQGNLDALVKSAVPHEFLLDDGFLASCTDKPRFSHAKVWHTAQRVGIGSWNLSFAALGLGGEFNVEAGFVLDRHLEKGKLEVMQDPSQFVMGDDELTRERASLEALELPAVAIRVAYDWKDCEWSWVCAPLDQNLSNVLLRIPGVDAIDLESRPQEPRLSGAPPLKDRFVSIEFHRNGQPGSQAVWVEERNCQERPLGEFESLDSLFVGLLQSGPGQSLEGDRFVLVGEDLEDDETSMKDTPLACNTIGYFRMFAAMRRARLRFQDEDATDPDVLRRRIRVEPGCLRELHAKVLDHCRERVGEGASPMSPTARWFWYHELGLVHEAALARCDGRDLLKDEVVAMREEAEHLASPLTPDAPLRGIIRRAVEGTHG